jgi:hypothetical protein
MIEAIGAPMMQAAIPVMKSFTEIFQKIGAWANANPETVLGIAKAITAIGIAMIGVGAVFVGAGIATAIGLMGPFAVGIAAIGTALSGAAAVYLVYKNEIKDIFPKMNAAFADGIVQWRDTAIAAISSVVSAIGSFIGSEFGKLKSSSLVPPVQQSLPWGPCLVEARSRCSPPTEGHSFEILNQ